jgi:hypothetical protein
MASDHVELASSNKYVYKGGLEIDAGYIMIKVGMWKRSNFYTSGKARDLLISSAVNQNLALIPLAID